MNKLVATSEARGVEDNGANARTSTDMIENGRYTKVIETVAHVRVVTGQGGGPEKTILNSPRFLERYGFRTICAYMHPPSDPGIEHIRAKAKLWNAKLVTLPDRGLRDIGIFWKLLNLCRQHRVGIWHAHDYKSNLFGLMLKPFWSMKLVTTVHGWGASGRRTSSYYQLDRHLLRYYERVICVSEDLVKECLEYKVPSDRCILVHNAIDTGEFKVQRDKRIAKQQAGIDPNRFMIGAVGRLAPEKAFDLLIHSIDQLLKEGQNVGLIIVGEGAERSQLEALIGQLDRGDRVKLLGFQRDVIPVYRMMDAFALSSLREGLPNVVLEALATGVPVVASRIAGVPRLIQDGCTGLLIDPGNTEQLTTALRQMILDPGLCDRLAVAGRKVVEARFSFEFRMEKIRNIYEQLIRRE
ncbi:MAG: glycosyltransferase family 4 protein [Pirellulales bacterium]|nr:glycosyltransferase family 4 protein [Pirellulales bacterium]